MPYTEDNEYDYRRNWEPKCPYCDERYEVEHADDYDLFTDGHEENLTCRSCDKEYKVLVDVNYYYSTEPIDK